MPERTIYWLRLLESVMAGNFVWSMTTARYNAGAEDYTLAFAQRIRRGVLWEKTTTFVSPIAPDLQEQEGMSDEESTSSKQLGCQRSSAEQLSNISTPPTSIDGQSSPGPSSKEAPRSRLPILFDVYGEVSFFDKDYL